jgi:hypothetical protein
MNMAGAGVVRVRMRNDRSLDGQPRINIKLPWYAKQPFFSRNHQISHERLSSRYCCRRAQ